MTSDGGVNWATTWTKTGDQGNSWQHAIVTATPFAHQVRFVGITGTTYTSDMAIDNFNVAPNVDCSLPTPAPTLSALPTLPPTFTPTSTPTLSSSPTVTRPQIEVTGACTSDVNLNDVYAPVSKTASGAVYYQGVFYGYYLFYEPDSDGSGNSNPMWLFDDREPSTTAAGDLVGDRSCTLWGYTYTTALEPPSGSWSIWCDSWTAVTLTLALTRVPVVNTQVGMSGLNCSGFSATIFAAALDMLIPNSTFSDSTCADTDAQKVEVATEVTTPRIYIVHGESLQEHVTHLLNESIVLGTFESTIQSLSSPSRRLDATSSEAHRRLTAAMASASVDSVTASTFAPSAAPTPMPSKSPTPAPTLLPIPTPTPAPSPVPSTPPSSSPTAVPSPLPSLPPTAAPSALPSRPPTVMPSTLPSPSPTAMPSTAPLPSPTAGRARRRRFTDRSAEPAAIASTDRCAEPAAIAPPTAGQRAAVASSDREPERAAVAFTDCDADALPDRAADALPDSAADARAISWADDFADVSTHNGTHARTVDRYREQGRLCNIQYDRHSRHLSGSTRDGVGSFAGCSVLETE